MPALDTPHLRPTTRHTSRSFADLPDAGAAVRLLNEIAGAPCLFSAVPMDRPLALYGAGDFGHLAHDFLNAVGYKAEFFIDRYAEKLPQGVARDGVKLLHPDEVANGAKCDVRLAVSVVTAPYVEIEHSLLQLGFTEVVPFYDVAQSFRRRHPLSNGWFASPLSASDRENSAEVLAGWADDVSRAHHLQFLAWRRLREEWIFERAPVSNSNRFFIPEIMEVLNGHETLFDGGAHVGKVADNFASLTNGAYEWIVAVEPDRSNRAELEKCASAQDGRLTIHDCALAENDSRVKFHDGLGYASQISSTGCIDVLTRPLDAFSVSPTYIKLHLEGGELNALKGARETLLSHRPIVAATVYHNADGIWRTPLWLMDTLPDYRFLFRAHSWCGTGAVLYAIPRERVRCAA